MVEDVSIPERPKVRADEHQVLTVFMCKFARNPKIGRRFSVYNFWIWKKNSKRTHGVTSIIILGSLTSIIFPLGNSWN